MGLLPKQQMLLDVTCRLQNFGKMGFEKQEPHQDQQMLPGFAVNPPGDFGFRAERVSPSSSPGWDFCFLKSLSREEKGCPVFSEASKKPSGPYQEGKIKAKSKAQAAQENLKKNFWSFLNWSGLSYKLISNFEKRDLFQKSDLMHGEGLCGE